MQAVKHLRTLEGHENSVLCAAISYNGQLIASGSADKSIKLWDTRTGVCMHTLRGHNGPITCIDFSPDCTKLASSSGRHDKSIILWALSNEEASIFSCTYHSNAAAMLAVKFSPDGLEIVFGCGNKTVSIWNVQPIRRRLTLQGHEGAVHSVSWSPDGSSVLSLGADNTLRLWNAADGSCLTRLQLGGDRKNGFNEVVFSRTSEQPFCVSANKDNTVMVWTLGEADANLLHIMRGHTQSVTCVSLSAKETFIASGGSDRSIRVWGAASGLLIALLKGHTAIVTSVSFSCDDIMIVSGSSDKTVRVWGVDMQVFALLWL